MAIDRLDILVEEPSMKIVLDELIPRIANDLAFRCSIITESPICCAASGHVWRDIADFLASASGSWLLSIATKKIADC